MKVERMDVMAFTITDVDRLDPIRVMIENYEPERAVSQSPASARHGQLPGSPWVVILFRLLLSALAMTI